MKIKSHFYSLSIQKFEFGNVNCQIRMSFKIGFKLILVHSMDAAKSNSRIKVTAMFSELKCVKIFAWKSSYETDKKSYSGGRNLFLSGKKACLRKKKVLFGRARNICTSKVSIGERYDGKVRRKKERSDERELRRRVLSLAMCSRLSLSTSLFAIHNIT